MVFWRKRLNSDVRRPANTLASKPTSYSRVRSGPRFGSPTVAGVNAGFPSFAATGDQLRTASNAPGALPASPMAARSLKLSAHLGHQSMSERMYEALILG